MHCAEQDLLIGWLHAQGALPTHQSTKLQYPATVQQGSVPPAVTSRDSRVHWLTRTPAHEYTGSRVHRLHVLLAKALLLAGAADGDRRRGTQEDVCERKDVWTRVRCGTSLRRGACRGGVKRPKWQRWAEVGHACISGVQVAGWHSTHETCPT